MPNLPGDEVEMERAIAGAIRTLLLTTPHVGQVQIVPRYPSTPEEDADMTQVEDPVVGEEAQYTNLLEIGIPTIDETESQSVPAYECEVSNLVFTYPITHTLGVADLWAKDDFPYSNSSELAIGTFMRARRIFKRNRKLGFEEDVLHFYLQLEQVSDINNEKGEALGHQLEWSLEVEVRGVKI